MLSAATPNFKFEYNCNFHDPLKIILDEGK